MKRRRFQVLRAGVALPSPDVSWTSPRRAGTFPRSPGETNGTLVRLYGRLVSENECSVAPTNLAKKSISQLKNTLYNNTLIPISAKRTIWNRSKRERRMSFFFIYSCSIGKYWFSLPPSQVIHHAFMDDGLKRESGASPELYPQL